MTAAVETGPWQLDPARSTVAFAHRTMWGLVTVKGTFGAVAGEGEVLPDGTARGSVTLEAASLDTGNAKRDQHLRGADFFDAERHPTLVLAVDEAVVGQDGTAAVTGRLTVRGESSPQSVTASIAGAGTDEVVLTAEFTVDRARFGMGWNQLGMIRGLATVTSTLAFVRTPA
ncbi:YceI family protein [Streptomyces fructofermentans]|uniref:YceI family protein n=1 Tax=Streptomyces fructofermentans TaxID=152141 RepID=UPI0016794EF9|nr:YceI family protein [Streptomyces fructofermentans]